MGEGKYNLNALKEIDVTESYLGLDQDVRGCQNKESFHNCTTRKYIDTLRDKCGCIPLNIRLSDMVNVIQMINIIMINNNNQMIMNANLIFCLLRNHYAQQPSLAVYKKQISKIWFACLHVLD